MSILLILRGNEFGDNFKHCHQDKIMMRKRLGKFAHPSGKPLVQSECLWWIKYHLKSDHTSIVMMMVMMTTEGGGGWGWYIFINRSWATVGPTQSVDPSSGTPSPLTPSADHYCPCHHRHHHRYQYQDSFISRVSSEIESNLWNISTMWVVQAQSYASIGSLKKTT